MKCTSYFKSWIYVAAMALFLAACTPSDEKIAEEVKTKLTALSPAINATVNNGVATLTGQVVDEATKAAAETAIQNVKGLKSVVNNLTVTPPPEPAPMVVINPDDTLRKGLDSVFSVKSIKGVTATVNDGVVTLTGTVKRSDLQKVMQAANELKPKKVVNQLTIK